MLEGNDSSAWAYRLGGDGSWFLKLLGRKADRGTLEVPRYLSSLRIGHLVAPISTVGGEPADRDGRSRSSSTAHDAGARIAAS
jgi:hypothetical protein